MANEDSGSVSVIDGYNDSQKTVIPVGQHPISIVPQHFSGTLNKKIYVLGNGTVSVIDVNSGHTTKNITVGENPSYIAIDYDTNKIYVTDGAHTVSVINGYTDMKEPNDIPVGTSPSSIAVLDRKVYVANTDDDTVSVIDSKSGHTTKNIPVGGSPSYLAADDDENIIYVANNNIAGNGTVSVIDGDSDHTTKNITVGENPSYILIDRSAIGPTISPAGGIYVANSGNGGNGTISVIPEDDDQKEPIDMLVGKGPKSMAIGSGVIYVANTDSNSISVIDMFSKKVAAGIQFNIYPANSGTIMCDKEEYPTNTYLYVDTGTKCIAQPGKGFEFNTWAESLLTNRNSSIPLDSSGNLTVNRYGVFTVNFKPLPPPIPPEYWNLIITLILTTMIGWSIPTIAGWVKARTQLKHLEECIDQIAKLDKNAIEDKIKRYYVQGKISEDHRQFLKDKISEYYDSVTASGSSTKRDD